MAAIIPEATPEKLVRAAGVVSADGPAPAKAEKMVEAGAVVSANPPMTNVIGALKVTCPAALSAYSALTMALGAKEPNPSGVKAAKIGALYTTLAGVGLAMRATVATALAVTVPEGTGTAVGPADAKPLSVSVEPGDAATNMGDAKLLKLADCTAAKDSAADATLEKEAVAPGDVTTIALLAGASCSCSKR